MNKLICKNCSDEFENRSSDYCSSKCALESFGNN
jgi:hypothetical protein